MESIRYNTSSHGLPSEMLSSQNATAKVHWQEMVYEDEKDEEIDTSEEVLVIDPDFKLFLKGCNALFQSRNSAVVVALVSCYLYLGPSDYLKDAAGPLVALLRSAVDIQQIALYKVVLITLVSPSLFLSSASHFLVRSSDPQHIW
jgi:AP-3 complex subunit beta